MIEKTVLAERYRAGQPAASLRAARWKERFDGKGGVSELAADDHALLKAMIHQGRAREAQQMFGLENVLAAIPVEYAD